MNSKRLAGAALVVPLLIGTTALASNSQATTLSDPCVKKQRGWSMDSASMTATESCAKFIVQPPRVEVSSAPEPVPPLLQGPQGVVPAPRSEGWSSQPSRASSPPDTSHLKTTIRDGCFVDQVANPDFGACPEQQEMFCPDGR